jgi:hypothetical protein
MSLVRVDFPLNPAQKSTHARDRTTHDKVVRTCHFFGSAVDALDVGNARGFGHSLDHLDLLADAVAQDELGIGMKHSEGEPRKSTTSSHIQDAAARLKAKHLGNAQAVENVPFHDQWVFP